MKGVFKEASDRIQQTGLGVDDEALFKQAALQCCSYYYKIKDIMIDCPSVNPIATKDDLKFIKLSSYIRSETSNGTGTHEVEVIRTDVASVPNLKKTDDTSDKTPSKKNDSMLQSTEYL